MPTKPPPPPAYRLRTPRLDLHAADPSRAIPFLEAANASVPELLPYMDWAAAMPDDDGIVQLMRTWRAMFDRDEDRHYHVVMDGRVLGVVGVHPRVRGNAREIGYWVRSDHAGRGLITEAVRGVARAELALMGLDRLDLYIEPDNVGSLRVAEKLGFVREATLRGRITRTDGSRAAVVSSLVPSDPAVAALEAQPLQAWDVLDRPLEIPPIGAT